MEFWSMRLENVPKLQNETKGGRKMDSRSQEIGIVKIKLNGLGKAAELNYPTLKLKIRYDERGVAEVPLWAAKKLLGPDFAGSGYELFEEVKTEESKVEKPKERKPKTQETKTAEQEFIAGIKD